MVDTQFLGASLATLASVNWVDLLIIGLMLLAAVHGLRLGALVQLLTFAGFWLGLFLDTLIWVHALAFIHHANERAGLTVAAVLVTAGALSILGRAARVIELRHPPAPSFGPHRRRARGRRGGRGRLVVVVAGGGCDPVPQ